MWKLQSAAGDRRYSVRNRVFTQTVAPGAAIWCSYGARTCVVSPYLRACGPSAWVEEAHPVAAHEPRKGATKTVLRRASRVRPRTLPLSSRPFRLIGNGFPDPGRKPGLASPRLRSLTWQQAPLQPLCPPNHKIGAPACLGRRDIFPSRTRREATYGNQHPDRQWARGRAFEAMLSL